MCKDHRLVWWVVLLNVISCFLGSEVDVVKVTLLDIVWRNSNILASDFSSDSSFDFCKALSSVGDKEDRHWDRVKEDSSAVLVTSNSRWMIMLESMLKGSLCCCW